MPLEPVPGEPSDDGIRFRLLMNGAGQDVFVFVTRGALEEIGSVEMAPIDYVARFRLLRAAIERIASAKFDAGHVDAQGVVHITAADRVLHPGA